MPDRNVLDRAPVTGKRATSMRLSAFLSLGGYAEGAWRLPESDPFCNTDLGYFRELARLAESGGFDALFIADSMELWGDVRRRPTGTFEPSVLAAMLLAATDHIGVIITLSTSFNEPFNVARRLASLDLASGGRIGWNIVTSASDGAAANFGLAQVPSHRERYERGREFVEVCLKLWSSWTPGSILGDKFGVWGDPAGVRAADHVGTYFSVAGPLDTPRSPQVVPLLVQAGSSEDGVELAATHADVVFTVQSAPTDAQAFRTRVRTKAAQLGRSTLPLVLPGLVPIMGVTADEAQDLAARLHATFDLESAVRNFEVALGLAVGSLHPDAPFNASLEDVATHTGNRGLYGIVAATAAAGDRTVADVVRMMNSDRGHLTVVGTATDVAETMIDWFERGSADGFNVIFPTLPGSMRHFVSDVMPVLRRAGYVGADTVEPRTLRERLGTDRQRDAQLASTGLSQDLHADSGADEPTRR